MPPRSIPTDPKKIIPPLLELDPYSAHQKTRTTAARLISHGHAEVAVDVLFEVSRELLKKGDAGSGVDLGTMMIRAYEGKEQPVGDQERARIMNLISLCPNTGNWRKTIINGAIEWSTKFHATPHPAGDPLLHHLIGSHLFRLGLYPLAEPHLLSSGSRDSGRLLGEMAFLWSRRGELDPSPYLLRVVLPFLLLSPPSILPARAALSTFLSLSADKDASFVQERLPLGDSDEILFTLLPVVNFLQLAVAAVQRAPAADAPAKVGDQALGKGWQEITTKYRAFGKPWMRDEHVKEAVAIISQGSFRIQPPRQGNNMMAELLQGLMGGGGGGR